MKVIRTLGSERVYLFEDGEKVPFGDKARFKQKRAGNKIVDIKPEEKKPRKWGRKKKGDQK